MNTGARLRKRMSVVMQMVIGFVVAILLAQLWLFTVALDAMQNEQASMAAPIAAFVCSALGSSAVWALIRFFLRSEAAN